MRKSRAAVIFPKNKGIDAKIWHSRFRKAKRISRTLVGVKKLPLCGKAIPKSKHPRISVPPERLK